VAKCSKRFEGIRRFFFFFLVLQFDRAYFNSIGPFALRRRIQQVVLEKTRRSIPSLFFNLKLEESQTLSAMVSLQKKELELTALHTFGLKYVTDLVNHFSSSLKGSLVNDPRIHGKTCQQETNSVGWQDDLKRVFSSFQHEDSLLKLSGGQQIVRMVNEISTLIRTVTLEQLPCYKEFYFDQSSRHEVAKFAVELVAYVLKRTMKPLFKEIAVRSLNVMEHVFQLFDSKFDVGNEKEISGETSQMVLKVSPYFRNLMKREHSSFFEEQADMLEKALNEELISISTLKVKKKRKTKKKKIFFLVALSWC